ncbi:MAG TPA: hypothetical protein VG266_09930 [Candidatus Dormibacteraeota bacterium]|jgi:hypothetical protein|nr:hypothetical protein [Candidatus Dormibacteraeota bacterium]
MTSGDIPAHSHPVGTRVTFPYGGSRRTGTVADVSLMPDGNGGSTVAYLVDVGQRKVFVQGDSVTLAGEGAPQGFDPVAEGVAYGRKRPRNPRRR